MPWLLDGKYFYYNEELLKAAGFDAPPQTWEELTEMAAVIKEKGIVEHPIVWSWAQAEAADPVSAWWIGLSDRDLEGRYVWPSCAHAGRSCGWWSSRPMGRWRCRRLRLPTALR